MTPTAELHPSLVIPEVQIVFIVEGAFEFFATNCSSEAFRRLETAAEKQQGVFGFSILGRDVSDDELAALNAYLRTPRALAVGGVLPFNRLRVTRSRWDWAMFLEYLDISA